MKKKLGPSTRNLLKISLKTAFLCALFCLLSHLPLSAAENAPQKRDFAHFSVILPPGWDGDEQIGFISDDKEEYMLAMTKKDADGDKIEAQVSVFLLPNKPGKNARESALALTEAQGDSTEPIQEGNFWIFRGEPRGNAVKGKAITRVNANAEKLLIIISQDPNEKEAAEIFQSLAGLSPEAREMLGR